MRVFLFGLIVLIGVKGLTALSLFFIPALYPHTLPTLRPNLKSYPTIKRYFKANTGRI